MRLGGDGTGEVVVGWLCGGEPVDLAGRCVVDAHWWSACRSSSRAAVGDNNNDAMRAGKQ